MHVCVYWVRAAQVSLPEDNAVNTTVTITAVQHFENTADPMITVYVSFLFVLLPLAWLSVSKTYFQTNNICLSLLVLLLLSV